MEQITAYELGEAAARADGRAFASASHQSPSRPQPLLMSAPNGAATSELYLDAPSLTGGPAEMARPKVGWASRLLDLSITLAILVVVAPLMVVCAIAIASTSKGPVIFRQKRIGRGGQEFSCLKFRTMTHCAGERLDQLFAADSEAQQEWEATFKLRCDPRVTAVGSILRRYSLDELPQLFNVLRGDMSIVGPRPIVDEEIRRYGVFFKDYCSVNPGITGLWQVSGRHKLSYNDRVHLDADYAARKSLRGDLLILLRTIPVVLNGQNE